MTYSQIPAQPSRADVAAPDLDSNEEIGTGEPTVGAATVDPPPRRRWRRLRVWLAFGVGIWLIVSLCRRTNVAELKLALQNVNYLWLTLGMLGGLCTPWVRSQRLRRLYEVRGRQTEVSGCLYQYGLLNMLLPLRASDIVLLGMLKSRGIIASIAQAVPRWIVLRLGDMTAVFVLVSLSALVVPFSSTLDRWVVGTRVAGVVILLVIAVGMIVLSRLPPGAPHPPEGFMASRLWALRRGLDGLHRPGLLSATLGWSLVLWVWHAIVLSIQYAAFPFDLNVAQLWAVSTAHLMISTLPIHAPLGIGTMHAFQVVILKAFDVPRDPAFAAALVIHGTAMLTMILQWVIGNLILLRFDRKARQNQTAAPS